MNQRQLGALPVVPFFIALGVCYLPVGLRESKNGDELTYTNELWVPILVLVVGLVAGVAGVAGWFLRRKDGRVLWGLVIIACPLVGLIVFPTMLMERSTVSPERFTRRGGFWGMSGGYDVQLDSVSTIRLTKETHFSRQRTSRSYYMICESKGGGSVKVRVGGKVAGAAASRFVEHAKARNIPVVNERDSF